MLLQQLGTLSNLILPKIFNHYSMLKNFSRFSKDLIFLKASTPIGLFKRNGYYFAESSRDIELKMRLQRLKGVQNKFKALHTSFGLHCPQTINSDYPKPSTIEFTIQSLRKYSHMYPEYLLKELNNKNSQFYEVIDQAVVGFQSVDNKEAIEFLQFLVMWRLYLHNETFEEVLVRKIYQMEMNLHELFKVLQLVVHVEKESVKKKIMTIVQEKILQKILDIDVIQYQALFKMLNFMRVHDLSPSIKAQTVQKLNQLQGKAVQQGEEATITEDSFFKVVEGVLLRDLDSIPLPNLVQMVVHYANNIKQEHDDVINILSKVEAKIIQNINFFNHDQLIAIMFSYIKTGTESPKLVEEFVKRVELLYFQITWENKKRILNLASSLPHNKWLYVVGLSIFEVLQGKKVVYRDGKKEVDPNAKEVEFQLLPTIYLAAYETNLATPELIDKIQPKILQQLFHYSAEDIGLVVWLFTITPPSLQPNRDNKNLLYVKLESIIQGGFNGSTFTLKDIAMLVWSLCNTGGKSNLIYKQNADFWKNIEFYIQERLGNRKQERMFNSCCQIMWAYGNNKPLTIKTINMIIDLIIDKNSKNELDDQMFVFELTTIASFFHSIKDALPKPIYLYLENLTIKYFQQLIQSMTYIEIMKMLKYTIYDDNNKLAQTKISIDLWQRIIEQFQLDLPRIDYASIMGVVGFVIVSPQGRKADPKVVELVKKLMARKASLQQLKKGVQSQ